MPQIDYAVQGGPRAEAALEKFWSKTSNLDALGPEIHRYLRRVTVRVFKSEGKEIGESWPWYTGSEQLYAFIKVKLVQGSFNAQKFENPGRGIINLLRWKPGQERLFPSLVNANHPEHVWNVDSDNALFEFGTKVPYAYKHQEGKGRGPWWAGFPKTKKRKFLGLGRKHVAEIRRMILRFVGV